MVGVPAPAPAPAWSPRGQGGGLVVEDLVAPSWLVALVPLADDVVGVAVPPVLPGSGDAGACVGEEHEHGVGSAGVGQVLPLVGVGRCGDDPCCAVVVGEVGEALLVLDLRCVPVVRLVLVSWGAAGCSCGLAGGQ